MANHDQYIEAVEWHMSKGMNGMFFDNSKEFLEEHGWYRDNQNDGSVARWFYNQKFRAYCFIHLDNLDVHFRWDSKDRDRHQWVFNLNRTLDITESMEEKMSQKDFLFALNFSKIARQFAEWHVARYEELYGW